MYHTDTVQYIVRCGTRYAQSQHWRWRWYLRSSVGKASFSMMTSAHPFLLPRAEESLITPWLTRWTFGANPLPELVRAHEPLHARRIFPGSWEPSGIFSSIVPFACRRPWPSLEHFVKPLSPLIVSSATISRFPSPTSVEFISSDFNPSHLNPWADPTSYPTLGLSRIAESHWRPSNPSKRLNVWILLENAWAAKLENSLDPVHESLGIIDYPGVWGGARSLRHDREGDLAIWRSRSARVNLNFLPDRLRHSRIKHLNLNSESSAQGPQEPYHLHWKGQEPYDIAVAAFPPFRILVAVHGIGTHNQSITQDKTQWQVKHKERGSQDTVPL